MVAQVMRGLALYGAIGIVVLYLLTHPPLQDPVMSWSFAHLGQGGFLGVGFAVGAILGGLCFGLAGVILRD